MQFIETTLKKRSFGTGVNECLIQNHTAFIIGPIIYVESQDLSGFQGDVPDNPDNKAIIKASEYHTYKTFYVCCLHMLSKTSCEQGEGRAFQSDRTVRYTMEPQRSDAGRGRRPHLRAGR